jgi:hypothetical protein
MEQWATSAVVIARHHLSLPRTIGGSGTATVGNHNHGKMRRGRLPFASVRFGVDVLETEKANSGRAAK